jgi:hypothetical protein
MNQVPLIPESNTGHSGFNSVRRRHLHRSQHRPVQSPTTPERNANTLSNPPSPVSQSTVIQRGGVSKEHKGFSSELRLLCDQSRALSALRQRLMDPDLFFGDDVRGDLSYGVCEVSIPYKRTPGTLPEPSIWSLEFTQDPRKHVVLMENRTPAGCGILDGSCGRKLTPRPLAS